MLFVLMPFVLLLGVYVALAYMLLKLSYWLGKRPAVFAMSALLVGFHIYDMVATIRQCSAAPVFVPPNCVGGRDCSEGEMIFACDGFYGLLANSFAYLLDPVLAFAVVILTFRVVGKSPRNKLGA